MDPPREGTSGEGSSALSSRRILRSVRVPNRPPRRLKGDVSARHGTLAANNGRAAPSATTDDKTSSLRQARVTDEAKEALLPDGEAPGRKGKKKVNTANGADGRNLGYQLQTIAHGKAVQ